MTSLIYKALNKFIKSRPYYALQLLLHGDLEYRIFKDLQFVVSTALLHQRTFLPFKNKHLNQDIVILACGPTVKDYQPIKGAITIGVNRSIYTDKVKLDYFFMEDFGNSHREERSKYNAYLGNNCIKFYGMADVEDFREGLGGFDKYFPPEYDAACAHALRYRYMGGCGIRGFEPMFPYDISTQALAWFGTVVFSAIQFALWTNPKRIFLVGCDCTDIGHFYSNSDKTGLNTKLLLEGYCKLKEFVKHYYPYTEIISVNPVGLKGLFKDWYQKDSPAVP